MEELLSRFGEVISIPWVRALIVVVLSIVVGKTVDVLMCRALRRLTRRSSTELDDQLIDHLHRPIFVSVVLFGLYLSVEILKMPEPYAGLTTHAIQTVIVLIWLVAGLKTCTVLLAGLARFADRVTWIEARTLPLFDNLAKILLFGGAVYFLLVIWNLNVAPWLASAGIIGIALGFAAKDTLANLFGGLFVIIDSPYKIGDFINLGSGERGMVTKIGLRSTRILTRNDVEITVPNAEIANTKISNESGGRWPKFRIEIRVGVAYGSDIDRVAEVLTAAAASVDLVAEDPGPRVRFHEMGDSALIFRVMGWIDEPVYRGQAIDGLNGAAYKALAREGIEIPFPQRVVHMKTGS